jgi:hypothetical protein
LWKYLTTGRDELLAVILILGAAGVHIALLVGGWPAQSAEEGTFGLEAMHIAYHGEFPVFMYGQDYMGTIEAYVSAVLFRLFGVSWFTLRLSMVLLFVLFLICLYLLTKLLYSPKLGLFTLALLCFGSFAMLSPQMMVLGGTAETLLFGTLLVLLATHLSLSTGQTFSNDRRWLRLAGFAAWGCCSGLGLWSHLLVAPFALASGLLLLLWCHREIFTLAPLALLFGLVLGLMPLILYNLHATPGHNSLNAFLTVYLEGRSTQQSHFYTLARQFIGTFLFTLPAMTGMNALYDPYPLPLPYFSTTSRAPLIDVLAMGGWSLGYMLLFALACSMALWGLWQLHKEHRTSKKAWTSKDHQMEVIYTAQLTLLLAAALTIALFLFSSDSSSRPWSTRYLIGLTIAVPALLWPLWNGVNHHLPRFTPTPSSAKLALIFRRTLLILLLCLFVGETLATTVYMGSYVADNDQVVALTHDLVDRGITRIYSGYWQCDRFIFIAQEKLICDVVNEDLSPGLTRYLPYRSIVDNDPNAAYVFPQGSVYQSNFEIEMGKKKLKFKQFLLDGYIVYLPQHSRLESHPILPRYV